MLALTTAIVSAVGLIAWRVHFAFEFLAAESFSLPYSSLLATISRLYLVGAAAASLERHFAAVLHAVTLIA